MMQYATGTGPKAAHVRARVHDAPAEIVVDAGYDRYNNTHRVASMGQCMQSNLIVEFPMHSTLATLSAASCQYPSAGHARRFVAQLRPVLAECCERGLVQAYDHIPASLGQRRVALAN